MSREMDMDEMALEMEQSQEQSSYEEMVSRIIETGYQERSLEEIEDARAASDLFQELTWQERAPLEQRLGNVRGMAKHLRSRPGRFHKAEIELLKTLRQLEEWGEELGSREARNMSEELNDAVERCTFEDTLFAATEDFFDLVKRLDEPWCV